MYNQLNAEQKSYVDSAFAALDDRGKIGQLVCERGAYLRENVGTPAIWMKKFPVGFFFVGSEVIQLHSENAGEINGIGKNSSGIPVVLCGDFECGIGDGVSGFTRLPRMMALSASFCEEDAYEYGRIIAQEGKQLNIRWAFGPVADLNVNRENPVTNVRCTGDNPDHAIRILSNVVRGMQENGCAAAPKHFPGDGSDTRNQHYVTSLNVLSKDEWMAYHGKVFKQLIDDGTMSLMVGHLGFPAVEGVDPESGNFRPATASGAIMTGLLREELGFKGIILTDALSMCGYCSWGEYEKRTLDSFKGGADVFLWPETERFFALMEAALADGRASRERLDDSCRRILSFKALLGVNKPWSTLPEKEFAQLATHNRKRALEMAYKSSTLLRNRNGMIPLKIKEKSKVLVLVTPESPGAIGGATAFYHNLCKRGYQVTYLPLHQFHGIAPVVDGYDAVFLVCNAQPRYSDVRGFNTALWSFMAHEQHRRWIIVSTGTPYYLYDVANADTYVNVYSDSPVSIEAALESIFGERSFLGRSPVGVPNCFEFGDGIITQ